MMLAIIVAVLVGGLLVYLGAVFLLDGVPLAVWLPLIGIGAALGVAALLAGIGVIR